MKEYPKLGFTLGPGDIYRIRLPMSGVSLGVFLVKILQMRHGGLGDLFERWTEKSGQAQYRTTMMCSFIGALVVLEDAHMDTRIRIVSGEGGNLVILTRIETHKDNEAQ